MDYVTIEGMEMIINSLPLPPPEGGGDGDGFFY